MVTVIRDFFMYGAGLALALALCNFADKVLP